MEHTNFTTSELVKITGFTIRQLDYWTEKGLVKPSVQTSHGPGTQRLYGIDNLIELQFIKQLKSFGWSTQKISEAVLKLKTFMEDENPLKKAVLIHGKSMIIAVFRNREGERIMLDALSSGGQQILPIVLELLMEDAILVSDTLVNEVKR